MVLESDGTRLDLLRAAVHFLQNPKVTNSTLNSKRSFLLNKGLKDEEIDEAINLALANLTGQQASSNSSGKWGLMLLLGACYGAYTLYKMYTLHKTSTPDYEQHHNEVMKRISDLQRLMEVQKSNLASEIQSIKSLMLNHNQFEGPPSIPQWQMKKEDTNTNNSVSTNNVYLES